MDDEPFGSNSAIVETRLERVALHDVVRVFGRRRFGHVVSANVDAIHGILADFHLRFCHPFALPVRQIHVFHKEKSIIVLYGGEYDDDFDLLLRFLTSSSFSSSLSEFLTGNFSVFVGDFSGDPVLEKFRFSFF